MSYICLLCKNEAYVLYIVWPEGMHNNSRTRRSIFKQSLNEWSHIYLSCNLFTKEGYIAKIRKCVSAKSKHCKVCNKRLKFSIPLNMKTKSCHTLISCILIFVKSFHLYLNWSKEINRFLWFCAEILLSYHYIVYKVSFNVTLCS